MIRPEIKIGDFVFRDSSGCWAQWLVSENPAADSEKMIPQRTMAEVRESTSYGRLYRVQRINGQFAICCRVRRNSKAGGRLTVDTKDTVTMQRTGREPEERSWLEKL